ncbi:MAG: VRR-NUC domain-containing protein [Sulfuritalea sp.]|nr:VRR-NUC domain-containing protein [Sulfuritalea sp.]
MFCDPYLHAGQGHDYLPDFIVRLQQDKPSFVIVETKGHDDRVQEKQNAAERWISAVNQDGRFGHWRYLLLRNRAAIAEEIRTELRK